jgi:hypothetical protein
MIELGRIDIMARVAMLLHFLANPQDGHLKQAYTFLPESSNHPSLTIKTVLLMKVIFMPVIVLIFTSMHRRRFLQMHQSYG